MSPSPVSALPSHPVHTKPQNNRQEKGKQENYQSPQSAGPCTLFARFLQQFFLQKNGYRASLALPLRLPFGFDTGTKESNLLAKTQFRRRPPEAKRFPAWHLETALTSLKIPPFKSTREQGTPPPEGYLPHSSSLGQQSLRTGGQRPQLHHLHTKRGKHPRQEGIFSLQKTKLGTVFPQRYPSTNYLRTYLSAQWKTSLLRSSNRGPSP